MPENYLFLHVYGNIYVCIGKLQYQISVSHKYSFLKQELTSQPDEPVEIKLYRANYEGEENNMK